MFTPTPKEMITYPERNIVGETTTEMQEKTSHKQWLHEGDFRQLLLP